MAQADLPEVHFEYDNAKSQWVNYATAPDTSHNHIDAAKPSERIRSRQLRLPALPVTLCLRALEGGASL